MRFVLAQRRSGYRNSLEDHQQFDESLATLEEAHSTQVVKKAGRSTRRIVILETDYPPVNEAEKKGLIHEPVLPRGHHPVIYNPSEGGVPNVSPTAEVGLPRPASTVPLQVNVKGSGEPVANAEITLVLTPRTVFEETTASDGRCVFQFGSNLTPTSVSSGPTSNFWTVAKTSPSQPVVLDLPPIEAHGPLAWWHETLGIKTFAADRGAGIRVGLIDTGVGPNPCLSQVSVLGSIIDGHFDPNGGEDVDYHGTLVCGLIAACPTKEGQLAGSAPGVKVYAICVFTESGDSNQVDVAASIDYLVDECQVDLINLSLTGTTPSELERDAIKYAVEKGTLCICAAGNNAGPICFPASYPEAVAVSALGKTGWGPPGSIAAQMTPAASDVIGRDGLFLAPFSSRGNGLACTAPGLGIISTFPSQNLQSGAYGEDSGTSLATPLALSSLAITLSESSEYLSLPRGNSRAMLARKLLDRSCKSLGIAAEFQGQGIPTIGVDVERH